MKFQENEAYEHVSVTSPGPTASSFILSNNVGKEDFENGKKMSDTKIQENDGYAMASSFTASLPHTEEELYATPRGGWEFGSSKKETEKCEDEEDGDYVVPHL